MYHDLRCHRNSIYKLRCGQMLIIPIGYVSQDTTVTRNSHNMRSIIWQMKKPLLSL